MIDKKALLAHIKAKADHPNLTAHAFLMGPHVATERGDFDEPDSNKTPHVSGGETPD